MMSYLKKANSFDDPSLKPAPGVRRGIIGLPLPFVQLVVRLGSPVLCRVDDSGLHRHGVGFDSAPGALSGRTMARIGLRMMPPFPSAPLSFRTADFLQSGWKAGNFRRGLPVDCEFSSRPYGLPPPFVHLAAIVYASF